MNELLVRMSNMTEDELCAVFDTGMFNDIVQSYVAILTKNDSDTMIRLTYLFDQISAKEAIRYFKTQE